MISACYNPYNNGVEIVILSDDECIEMELEAILVSMSKDKRLIPIVTKTLNKVADIIAKEL